MEPINPNLLCAEKITFDKKFFSQSGQKKACKRLKIVNLVPPVTRPNLKEENWKELDHALTALLVDWEVGKDFVLPNEIKFHHLHNLVRDIVRLGADDSADLYRRLKTKFEDYINNIIRVRLLASAQYPKSSHEDSLEKMEIDDTSIKNEDNDDQPKETSVTNKEDDNIKKEDEDDQKNSVSITNEDRLKFNEQFIRTFHHYWQYYLWQVRIVRNIFMILDRDYILQIPQLCALTEMCIELYRNCIQTNSAISEKLIGVLLLFIEMNRKSKTKQDLYNDEIKATVSSLFEMSLYKELFEQKFLQHSRLYYNKQTYDKFQENFTSEKESKVTIICEYLKFIQNTIENESSRITNFGIEQHSTGKILIQIIEHELLATRLQSMVDLKEFNELFDSKEYTEDLNRAFVLFGRVRNGQRILSDCYGRYVRNNGKRMIQKSYSNVENNKNSLIEDLLEFLIRMELFLKESFQNSDLFRQEMRSSFKSFINIRTSKIPAMLAKYINSAFDSVDIEDKNLVEFEKILDKSLLLFDLIYVKEIFEAFFQRDLAKRLLSGMHYNIDAEKMFISKYSQHSDNNFGTRLEGMFKDVDHSKELTKDLQDYLQQNESLNVGFDMSISMLTKCHWAATQHLEFQQPDEFHNCQKLFTDFYSSKYAKRKLVWEPAFSHCIVKAELHCGIKELHASYLQTLIVLLFNQHDQLTFQEMAFKLLVQGEQKKGAEDCVLRMTVQSLIFGEYPLLKKSPNNWDVHNDDLISLNEHFQCAEDILKITQIQWKEMEEKNNIDINQTAEDNRCTVLDCKIVQIMKKNKTLTKQNLVTEIYKSIDFASSSIEINARIENLVERYFLKKDAKTPEILHYVT